MRWIPIFVFEIGWNPRHNPISILKQDVSKTWTWTNPVLFLWGGGQLNTFFSLILLTTYQCENHWWTSTREIGFGVLSLQRTKGFPYLIWERFFQNPMFHHFNKTQRLRIFLIFLPFFACRWFLIGFSRFSSETEVTYIAWYANLDYFEAGTRRAEIPLVRGAKLALRGSRSAAPLEHLFPPVVHD